MHRTPLILGALASLIFSASAAAFDETRDDIVAPGLHFTMTFGGAAPARLDVPRLRDEALAADGTASSDSGSTRRTWIIVGVVAAVAIVAVAASSHGGGGGGGGGY